MEITDNLFRYVNIYQDRYFWVFDGDWGDLTNENYIFCRKDNGFLQQLPPKVTESTFYKHEKLQEYLTKLHLDKEAFWGLIIYIYTLHLVKYCGKYMAKLSNNNEAKRVQDFVKANIDNLEVIVRIKGEKKQRPFSVTDKIVLVSLFPIFGENLSNDRANEIRILLKECIDNENTILNITIRAKKAVKSDVITLSNKKDIERVFVLAEPTHKLFDDNDYLYINKDTPKAESERAFNFFFVTELLKAIRLIIPNESECATTDEKYLLLYTLDFLCLHSFDDNTIHLNKDEELYYRNRLEYYNKLLIDYEGYEANTMGSYFYGHDIKVD